MKKIVSIMGICAALGLTACGEKQVVAENGDTVVINFAGFLDGVQFPGGTAENFPLKLGSDIEQKCAGSGCPDSLVSTEDASFSPVSRLRSSCFSTSSLLL